MKHLLAVAGLFALIAPAAVALEIEDAMRMCAEHPDCTHGERDAGGSLTLFISSGPNHATSMHCPQAGDCVLIRRSTPYLSGGGGDVERMLKTAPSAAPVQAEHHRSGC